MLSPNVKEMITDNRQLMITANVQAVLLFGQMITSMLLLSYMTSMLSPSQRTLNFQDSIIIQPDETKS
jgi:hypothetical protein